MAGSRQGKSDSVPKAATNGESKKDSHELLIRRIAIRLTLPVEKSFVLRSLGPMKMGLQTTAGKAQSLCRAL